MKDKILKELNWDTVSFSDSNGDWFEGIDKADFDELAERLVKLFCQLDVIKSVCPHEKMSYNVGMLKCVECGYETPNY